MKKFVAILCAVAMTLALGTAAFANPSMTSAGISDAKVSPATAAKLPAGTSVQIGEEIDDAYLAKIPNAKVAEAISKLNDPDESITMGEMLELLEFNLDEPVLTEGGVEINPLDYDPLVNFASLDLLDANGDQYGEDLPEDFEVEVTLTMEALIDAVAEDLLFMQLDPKSADVAFIEVDEETFDAETGEVTVAFPGFGPFTVLEKTA